MDSKVLKTLGLDLCDPDALDNFMGSIARTNDYYHGKTADSLKRSPRPRGQAPVRVTGALQEHSLNLDYTHSLG